MFDMISSTASESELEIDAQIPDEADTSKYSVKDSNLDNEKINNENIENQEETHEESNNESIGTPVPPNIMMNNQIEINSIVNESKIDESNKPNSNSTVLEIPKNQLKLIEEEEEEEEEEEYFNEVLSRPKIFTYPSDADVPAIATDDLESDDAPAIQNPPSQQSNVTEASTADEEESDTGSFGPLIGVPYMKNPKRQKSPAKEEKAAFSTTSSNQESSDYVQKLIEHIKVVSESENEAKPEVKEPNKVPEDDGEPKQEEEPNDATVKIESTERIFEEKVPPQRKVIEEHNLDQFHNDRINLDMDFKPEVKTDSFSSDGSRSRIKRARKHSSSGSIHSGENASFGKDESRSVSKKLQHSRNSSNSGIVSSEGERAKDSFHDKAFSSEGKKTKENSYSGGEKLKGSFNDSSEGRNTKDVFQEKISTPKEKMMKGKVSSFEGEKINENISAESEKINSKSINSEHNVSNNERNTDEFEEIEEEDLEEESFDGEEEEKKDIKNKEKSPTKPKLVLDMEPENKVAKSPKPKFMLRFELEKECINIEPQPGILIPSPKSPKENEKSMESPRTKTPTKSPPKQVLSISNDIDPEAFESDSRPPDVPETPEKEPANFSTRPGYVIGKRAGLTVFMPDVARWSRKRIRARP